MFATSNHLCSFKMADMIFEVEPPLPDSDEASQHAVEYVRRRDVLAVFRSKAGFYLDSSILEDCYPDPMPLASHLTVINYAKFIMETRGNNTISVRVPVGKKLSNVVEGNVYFAQFPAGI